MFKLIENIFKGMCLWVYCMYFGTLKQRIISNLLFGLLGLLTIVSFFV